MNIQPNANGVYPGDEAETLSYSTKQAGARIRILQIPSGWISAGDYEHRQGSCQGRWSPLTAHVVWGTRDEAIQTVAAELRQAQIGILKGGNSAYSEGQRREAARIIAWLDSLANHQLQLF